MARLQQQMGAQNSWHPGLPQSHWDWDPVPSLSPEGLDREKGGSRWLLISLCKLWRVMRATLEALPLCSAPTPPGCGGVGPPTSHSASPGLSFLLCGVRVVSSHTHEA